MADVYVEQSKLSVAEELYKDVLAVRIRILGPEHPAVAQTLHSMAHRSYFHGHYAHAEQLYHQVLMIREKAQLLDHPELAQMLKTYANLLLYLNRKTEAAETLERVKTIRAKHADD